LTKGIQITKEADIDDAKGTDFVVNSDFAGSIKIHSIQTFFNGGDRVEISNFLGLFALIQRKPHELDYVPAYIAYRGYGAIGAPELFAPAYNNFIGAGGGSDFVNVDEKNIVVGFDEVAGADFIKVIIFAERLE
jgi:hypothetical protein